MVNLDSIVLGALSLIDYLLRLFSMNTPFGRRAVIPIISILLIMMINPFGILNVYQNTRSLEMNKLVQSDITEH